jgi:indolepyruvate ferredoxin oxidoreductase beta subunit
MKKLDLVIAGVGGQGVILASDIISETAIAAGYDLKKTDTLGMAQRGGSVISHIRMASQVRSPLIREGKADIMLAFEKLEGARLAYFLRPGGTAILNNQAQPPPSVSIGTEQYPADEKITGILEQRTESIYYIDGTRRAEELGNVRASNTFLLGCLSLLLPFKIQIWKDSIAKHLAPANRKINLVAFDQGRKEMRAIHP